MLADALHWFLMAWSRRRKLSLLLASVLLGLAASCLLNGRSKPSWLHSLYQRVKVGMTAGEVCDLLVEDHPSQVRPKARALWLAAIRPSSAWSMGGENGVDHETLIIGFDGNLRVANKRFESDKDIYSWFARILHW